MAIIQVSAHGGLGFALIDRRAKARPLTDPASGLEGEVSREGSIATQLERTRKLKIDELKRFALAIEVTRIRRAQPNE